MPSSDARIRKAGKRGSRIIIGVLLVAGGMFVVPDQASAQASTIYVNQANPACTDAGNGTPAAPYCTIVKAAQKATSGPDGGGLFWYLLGSGAAL